MVACLKLRRTQAGRSYLTNKSVIGIVSTEFSVLFCWNGKLLYLCGVKGQIDIVIAINVLTLSVCSFACYAVYAYFPSPLGILIFASYYFALFFLSRNIAPSVAIATKTTLEFFPLLPPFPFVLTLLVAMFFV